MTPHSITVSVVSHGQNALLNRLLEDLARYCSFRLHVIVTENVRDSTALQLPEGQHEFTLIANERPKGFGANHNSAFERSTSPIFFVINPDIRLTGNPFTTLTGLLSRSDIAAVGPAVQTTMGVIEDSARKFPTLASLVKKLARDRRVPDYPVDKGPLEVDWIAGMFVGFRREAYARAKGFDERYFLYYEDVDICRRLRNLGYRVIYDPSISVVHEARRASRRNARLMSIHARSAIRYLLSHYRDERL
jgi:N-acetylglucosaminyl-diphospho-decaprenol L-rhamnosyltransferase